MSCPVGDAAGAVVRISLASPQYPDRLRRIHDPPSLLYARGELRPEEPIVAVVGSRRATATGRAVAERLAAGLAQSGVAVVSGLARGIDGIAHQAALAAGGRTIAVLGCGWDVVYPPEHGPLMEAIVRRGCVLTEFPAGTPPLRQHFPQRNRIIAGMALGVVVVEGDEQSGALSTAGHALDEGREVMAVPGSVLNPLSRAPNGLLRQGATLVESADEVLAAVGLPVGGTAAAPGDPDIPEGPASAVWRALAGEAVHIDHLALTCDLSVADVAVALTGLELRGLVRQLPGKHFIRAGGGSLSRPTRCQP